MKQEITLTAVGCCARKKFVVSVPQRLNNGLNGPVTVVLALSDGEYQLKVGTFGSTTFTYDELEAIARQLRFLNKVHRR